MRYVIHALVVSTFLLGSDYVVNDGAETTKAIHDLELQALWHDVKLQHYHAAKSIRQEVLYYRPELAMVRAQAN